MDKLYYCSSCKRVLREPEDCEYCKSNETEELLVGKPVNVIGTKLKGKVLKIKKGMVTLLMVNENNEKYMKDYEAEKLRKVL